MSLSRRILVISAVVAATALAVGILRNALASEETRIRRVIRSMESGFNRGRPRRTVAGLDADFRETRSGLTRDEIRAWLATLFFRERSRGRGRPAIRVEVPGDGWTVLVEPGGDRAETEFLVRFHRRSSDRESPIWEIRVRGDLEKRDGDWKIVQADHVPLSGENPFR
jgi:hypothetical protein